MMMSLLSPPAAVDPKLMHNDNDYDYDDDEISSNFGPIHVPGIEGSVSADESDEQGDTDTDDEVSSVISDCESVVSGNRAVEATRTVGLERTSDGLVKLEESDKLHEMIERKFVTRLSGLGIKAKVECIRRNMFNANAIGQARLSSFQIYAKALEKKIGSADVNVKYAWFGGSKAEIDRIIAHGFGYENIAKNGGFGHGVVLSADHSPLNSVESAIVDGDGVKHILLCRVLVGKTELVNQGSAQCCPSSEDFQTGVDDMVSPKKYIVWSSHMNSHILPEFVISFKALMSVNKPQLNGVRLEKPVSPWIPIPQLIAALSKILPSKAIKEITQYRHSYIERKISRRDMIKGIRKVAGDRVLLVVLKDFTAQRRFK
uniref:probable inactive poly [ADP-ribose] polymerase SRO5 n=1 Tax=Erigeron canadensis TaxID=72917 RepID=UPI001CB99982|nr:probable inactive poly [ADP-ribose] polymerase SRO5 [Erigeron canadensis]